MKELLNKIEEKIIFNNVVKRLFDCLMVTIIFSCFFTLKDNINAYDNDFRDKSNEYITVKEITDGVISVNYKTENENDKAAIYVTKNGGTKYKYILNPYENYIIALTEGIGDYVIETYSVSNGEVSTGEDIVVHLDKDTNYIYKISTSDVNFNSAKDIIEEKYGDIDDIDDIAKRISKFGYDSTFASNVKNGNIQNYTPDIARFLTEEKGVCIDAATALTAIYRYKGYEAQLLYGYIAGNNEYHSWVRVLENGEWVTFDPTLHKSGRVVDDSRYMISEYH